MKLLFLTPLASQSPDSLICHAVSRTHLDLVTRPGLGQEPEPGRGRVVLVCRREPSQLGAPLKDINLSRHFP